jgi:hypothetical protein
MNHNLLLPNFSEPESLARTLSTLPPLLGAGATHSKESYAPTKASTFFSSKASGSVSLDQVYSNSSVHSFLSQWNMKKRKLEREAYSISSDFY